MQTRSSRPSLRDLRSLLAVAEQRSMDAAAFASAEEAGREDGRKAADRLVEIIAADPLAADAHDAALDQALAFFQAKVLERRATGECESEGFAYYLTASVAVVEVLDRCATLARAPSAGQSSH